MRYGQRGHLSRTDSTQVESPNRRMQAPSASQKRGTLATGPTFEITTSTRTNAHQRSGPEVVQPAARTSDLLSGDLCGSRTIPWNLLPSRQRVLLGKNDRTRQTVQQLCAEPIDQAGRPYDQRTLAAHRMSLPKDSSRHIIERAAVSQWEREANRNERGTPRAQALPHGVHRAIALMVFGSAPMQRP
jgi:hypothetical protein